MLSTVNVLVNHDATLQIELDGEPYAADRTLARCDLRLVIDEITTRLGEAVRVELREVDGTTFTDIHTPHDLPLPGHEEAESEVIAPALTGAGFRPGEPVALAYVVARQAADADGKAIINLPPALLAAARSGLVLLGLDSLNVAPIET